MLLYFCGDYKLFALRQSAGWCVNMACDGELVVILALTMTLELKLVVAPTSYQLCPGMCSCLGNVVDCSHRSLTAVPDGLPLWTETLWVCRAFAVSVLSFMDCVEFLQIDDVPWRAEAALSICDPSGLACLSSECTSQPLVPLCCFFICTTHNCVKRDWTIFANVF